VTFAPVNLLRNPWWFRDVLVALQGVVWVWLLATAIRGRREFRSVAAFAIGWLVLANVPIYNAPFEAATSVDLRSSRLLYEPTLAVVAGVALFVSRFSLRRVAIAFVVFAFAVAFANAGPWCETERIARRLEVVMREDPPPTGPEWVVDLPSLHDGAFLFTGHDPRVSIPFARPEVVGRLTLARDKQWEGVLHRIDEHVRGGRVDGLRIRRLVEASRRDCALEVEPVAAELPAALGDGFVVRAVRCRGFDVRVGGHAQVDALVAGPAGHDRVALRAILVHEDDATEFASPILTIPDPVGVHAITFAVDLPVEAPIGRYRLRIALDGATAVPFSAWVDVQSARSWPD
ncbi:MAG: hypothetical protein KDB80_01570, partial [Planctomycetes bacterium]|nr:hypothetical protein [Planctomycetota bacterium]